jgi:hypothetical protein
MRDCSDADERAATNPPSMGWNVGWAFPHALRKN